MNLETIVRIYVLEPKVYYDEPATRKGWSSKGAHTRIELFVTGAGLLAGFIKDCGMAEWSAEKQDTVDRNICWKVDAIMVDWNTGGIVTRYGLNGLNRPTGLR